MRSQIQLKPQGNSWPILTRIVSTSIVIALFSIVLAACGSFQQASAQNSSLTPVTQPQDCGNVQTNPRGIPIDSNIAKQATDCFWQAYQKCLPATLVYNLNGLDTTAVHTFTTQSNNGKCTISETSDHYIAPHYTKPLSSNVYSCADLTQKADGLYFSSCGQDGEIYIPNSNANSGS